MATAIAALQARMDRSPFLSTMGVRVDHVADGEIAMHFPWQDWYVATPELGGAAGGIMGIVIDTATCWAAIGRTGHVWVTIDMRTDFHSRAEAGPLRAVGKVVRLGRTISTADANVFDNRDKLVASGRASLMAVDIPIPDFPKEA